jgi:hypothetical protein
MSRFETKWLSRPDNLAALADLPGQCVTDLVQPAEPVVAFYNQRGTAEQWDQGGQSRDQMDPAVVPHLRRTPAMPKAAEPWSLTSLREKLIEIGAKVVSHGYYITFQKARWRCRDRSSPTSCR